MIIVILLFSLLLQNKDSYKVKFNFEILKLFKNKSTINNFKSQLERLDKLIRRKMCLRDQVIVHRMSHFFKRH